MRYNEKFSAPIFALSPARLAKYALPSSAPSIVLPLAHRPVPQDCACDVLLRTGRFLVERRVFTRAGQAPLTREYVVHPGSVIILPILPDGRVVMNRQVRPGVEAELLELPAGTLEPNEDPLGAARRELEEETGYAADRIEPLGEFYTSPGFVTELMRAFVATELRPTKQNLDDGEQITVEIVDIDTVRTMVLQSTLRDAKTIAVLAMYLLKLEAHSAGH